MLARILLTTLIVGSALGSVACAQPCSDDLDISHVMPTVPLPVYHNHTGDVAIFGGIGGFQVVQIGAGAKSHTAPPRPFFDFPALPLPIYHDRPDNIAPFLIVITTEFGRTKCRPDDLPSMYIGHRD